MRWGPKAITALLALAFTWGAACGGGGHHDATPTTTRSSFPQGFLPVLAGTGRGDVTMRVEGDLFAVDGSDELIVVSHADGSVVFHDVDDTEDPALLSITPGDDGRLFAGDDAGRIWAISGNGSAEAPFAATLFVDIGSGAITGLAFAPSGFGDLGGSLLAAAGTAGIWRITISDTPAFASFAAGDFPDLAFSGTTLFAIKQVDLTHGEIDTVSSSGSPTTFLSGFVAPVGIAVDSNVSEIYVADAGDDALYTVPASGGARTKRAAYDFDGTEPSGLAYDGVGTIAFITAEPAIRGSNLPRVDPANTNFGKTFPGPTVGYGDLEFDRSGGFVFVANNTTTNFVFSASRDLGSFSAIQSGTGETGEQLLSLAIDPKTQAIYLGTDLGNLFRRTSDGTVTQLMINPPDGARAMLGLELAPPGFCAFDPCLVAAIDSTATRNGVVFEIDPNNPGQAQPVLLSGPPGVRFSDLVFASDGTLYVLDCDDDNDVPIESMILARSPGGGISELPVAARLDGIEIDEGGNRLLVVGQTTGPDQLLEIEITLPISSAPDPVALADVDVDDGHFPTGIIYDRLGNVAVRRGNNSTALQAESVAP